MEEIYLNCVLMDNNEILFCGKSLGFLTKEQKNKYTTKTEDIQKRNINP